MSANCEYYESLMSRMLDGDLLNAETDALRDHIRTCKSCRTLCAAFSGMTLSLRDDLVEAPQGLAASVMGRIRTYEAERALETDEPAEEPVPLTRTRAGRTKKKARWMPTVIAACLVLVIGVGAVSTLGRGGKKSADTAETATFSRAMEAQSNAEAPAAMAEESVAFDMAGGTTNAEESAVEPAAAPEATEAETTAADDTGAAVQGYTVSDPAFVPEGSEAAFEALLTDGGAIPSVSLHVFYYVEHRGVIYEFMTDEGEEYLLWRDAAEGFPTLSQSSFDDLWAIFK